MGRMRALRLVLALVIAFPVLRAAPAYSWHGSGNVTALAVAPSNPSIIYARTSDRGVFKSTDGGASWNATGGLKDVFVWTLAVDPSNPDTLFAGTHSNGVLKSTDGGASWSTTGLTNIPVSALAIAPSNSTTLYAVIGGYYAGLYKSTDGGASWNWSAAGLTNVLFGSLVFDPQNENTVYAASESGVFKSTDGGATWSAFNGGLTDFLTAYGVGPSVGPLAIDPLTPTTLYAGTSIGVFKSTDGAAYWSPTGLTQHSPLHSLSLNPTSVTAGTVSTGTVTLIAPAPVGGAVVTLSSGNTAIATVPASVTVPAGATSATFAVSTSSNPPSTPVAIWAAFDDAIRSAMLYVTPPPLSVSLNPTSVTAGAASTGTVTLSASSPAGGAVVTLFASDPTVGTVPASG